MSQLKICSDSFATAVERVLGRPLFVFTVSSVYSFVKLNYPANYRQCYQRSKQFLEPIREGIFPVRAKNRTEHPSVFKDRATCSNHVTPQI